MKIFASYDHKNKQGVLIEKIKDELAKSGHALWVDSHENYPGVDWRRNIIDGIRSSQATIAFLSEYSHSDRSACLDELAVAVTIPGMNLLPIMLEKPGSFRVPPTVSQKQWLDLSDWQLQMAKPSEHFDEYVRQKVEIILEVIESDTQQRFLGEIETLHKLLRPEIKRARYFSYLEKPLAGREWLFDKLNGYARCGKERFMFITAGPGYGKSHFMAEAMHYNPFVIAGYFFDYTVASKTTPRECLVSIAYQIAARLPDYRDALINLLIEKGWFDLEHPEKTIKEFDSLGSEKLFKTLFGEAMFRTIDGEKENMLIVLDGLDEAAYNGSNEMLNLLRRADIVTFPSWLKIVFSARPLPGIKVAIDSMDVEQIRLDCRESDEDIYKYFEDCLSTELQNNAITVDDLRTLTKRCERTFLYADAFMQTYRKDPTILDNLDEVPSGLNGLYDLYFQRLFENQADEEYKEESSRKEAKYPDEVRKYLEVIVANTGSISKNLFLKILETSSDKYQAFLRTMGSFVVITDSDLGEGMEFYHKAIFEWLEDEQKSDRWTISAEQGRHIILTYCRKILTHERKPERYYRRLPFEEMDFCYKKIKEFYDVEPTLYDEEYDLLMEQLCFLFYYQRETYNRSLHEDSNRVFDEILLSSDEMDTETLSAYDRYLPWAYDIRAEVEIAEKNWENALNFLNEAKRLFTPILYREIDIYALLERNIAFCYKNVDPDLGARKMEELLVFLDKKTYSRKTYDLAHTYYHLCVLYYNKANFEASIDNGLKALELAPKCHDDTRELSIIVDNELGWSYFRSGDNINAEKHFRNSLNDRISFFGRNSRYTALGYDAMARFMLYQAKNANAELSPEAKEYAITGLNIYEQLFGRRAITTARSLQTMALVSCYLNELDDAEAYAIEAKKIYEAGGKFEAHALKITEQILEEICTKMEKVGERNG